MRITAAAVFLLAAIHAEAANLLANPGFESNNGHAVPVGWTRIAPPNVQPFGNYWIEGTMAPKAGQFYRKQWGASYVAGATKIAGIGQDFSSAPGSVYQAGGWFFTRGSDVLGPDCATWLEAAFLDASTNLLDRFARFERRLFHRHPSF